MNRHDTVAKGHFQTVKKREEGFGEGQRWKNVH